MAANITWDSVPLPKGKKPITCKWVYKIKHKANGPIECFKARLVVRGFTQKPSIDFHETCSTIVKITTIHALIAIAMKMGWVMHQLDVNNAFLHGDLDKEIYMKPPPGLLPSSPTLVCKLNKPLYGLKQTSYQWYARLTTAIKSRGFIKSQNDYSLFSKRTGDLVCFIAENVDDLLVSRNDTLEVTALKSFLDAEFKIKDLGHLHCFLGIENLNEPTGVIMAQQQFALDLIQEFDPHFHTTTISPLEARIKLLPDADPLYPDPISHQSLVVKLNFLTHT